MKPVQTPYATAQSQDPTAGGADNADLFDWSQILDYARFTSNSLRRHKWLAGSVFLSVVPLALVAAWGLPKTYHVESHLLAQRNQVIGAIAVPYHLIPESADSPTRLVAETVLRRDNLLAMVKKTGLVAEWDRHRAPLAKLKDLVMTKLGRVPSEKDKIDILEATLETRLTVQMQVLDWGEGTVTFAIDWPEPGMAYSLVIAAQQSFLESRHAQEIDNISEALSILSERAAAMRAEIDAAALQIEDARAERKAHAEAKEGAEPGVVHRRSPPRFATAAGTGADGDPARLLVAPPSGALFPSAGVAPESQLSQIKSAWETKRAAIRDLEDVRHRRLIELQAKLTEQRATYGEAHPVILDTLRSIDALSNEPNEVVQLRREEADLLAQYRSLAGHDPDAPARSASPAAALELGPAALREPTTRRSTAALAPLPQTTPVGAGSEWDERTMEFARAQLSQQVQSYYHLMDRIEAARMELETSEVAFKYRYTVIMPAQVPSSPAKPKVPLLVASGVIAGALLALFAAVAADLRSRRILERWQIERSLQLPVIADLRERV